ncbi:hypothetical protein [Pseudoalteromonas sp. HM-SA03]|uniref:hypothetical protein n=1 Tax=Pseudoalteromonas sp. HM-SA03 TaxID=2029678 RepID=UPI001595DFF8|nr:hypothetical protein [Pseudoalteromonas sp. HM-SA03]
MPKHKTAEQWLKLIEQQELSGLSVTDFCTQLKHGQNTVLLPSNTDTLWLAALLRALS